MRVVTFNVANRGARIAKQLGRLVAHERPDLLLLQEANVRALPSLVESAGLEWAATAYDAGATTEKPKRTCAIAGVGERPRQLVFLADAPFPEKFVAAKLGLNGRNFIAASYHAPPGVTHGYKKVEQALALQRWVTDQRLSIILGADANTPRIDHPDAALVRTHWHTGSRQLDGAPGDDTMFGGAPEHALRDAFRVWLAAQPERMAEVIAERPTGPLAVSLMAGRRRSGEGAPRRYDTLWISPEWTVLNMHYDLDAAVSAGSDHAIVRATIVRADS